MLPKQHGNFQVAGPVSALAMERQIRTDAAASFFRFGRSLSSRNRNVIRQRRTAWQLLALTVLSALISQGCACFSCCSSCWSHIDPTGNHIFQHGSVPPAVAATEAPLYVPAGDPTPTPPPPSAAPLAVAPIVTPPPVVVPPPVVAAPTAPPVLPPDTSGVTLIPLTGVSVSPVQVVAPVGSEVVMIASVFNPQGRGMPRQRIEWTIAGGGVGQFVSPGQRASWDLYNLARGLPKKVNSTYVINSTLTYPVDLTRGTPSPVDDIPIKTGQAWVTVSSPVEGNTFLTAYAPGVAGWDHRQQTGTIYWLDAQWTFPPPAIDAAGSRNALSTAVVRQTDGTPLAGWTVRYEVAAGGPPAGFAPDGGNVVEVTTDSTGRATAEILQHAPAPGTNTVNIQVIRPAGRRARPGVRSPSAPARCCKPGPPRAPACGPADRPPPESGRRSPITSRFPTRGPAPSAAWWSATKLRPA